ncbi:MAG: Gfo/Idh/MocA family oxidoreductase [Ignavibacteriaceae bacterium]
MLNIRKTKSKKLKWGIAGLGRFAENSFIPALSHLRRSSFVSVYSSDEKRAKEIADKFGLSNYFSSYDDFLKSDIDVVYVSSANHNHYEQVIKAAKAGKHILCEKPMAINAAQAEEMVKVCEENKVQLAVNYVFRFHPLIVKAKELLDNQKIGKLISVQVNFNIDFPPGNNFRNVKEKGGGSLYDLGTHLIDLLRFFGGEISAISGVLDNLIYKSDVDDFASAIVKFKKTGYGYFNVSFNGKRAFNRIDILGHSGAISIENLIGVKHHPAKITILHEGEAKKTFMKRANKLVLLLKSVQKSFIDNQAPAITGYDGLINLKLMEELERNNPFTKVL